MPVMKPIHWTSSCEGTKKPESVRAKFILHQNLCINPCLAFVDEWLQTGKGLLAHKYVMILVQFNFFDFV